MCTLVLSVGDDDNDDNDDMSEPLQGWTLVVCLSLPSVVNITVREGEERGKNVDRLSMIETAVSNN